MIGIGTDILTVDRIAAVVERQGERFVKRILTPIELSEYAASTQPLRLLAKRFAAKEAVVKAIGTGIGNGVSWQDICVQHDALGAPLVVLTGGALARAAELGGCSVLLSLADEKEYVVAFAVLVP
jgi:holo-[acyl-carrier protein] synthase